MAARIPLDIAGQTDGIVPTDTLLGDALG